MKDFQMFREYLYENKIDKMIIQSIECAFKKLDLEDKNMGLIEVAEILTVSNFDTMLNLLELYHNWLNSH